MAEGVEFLPAARDGREVVLIELGDAWRWPVEAGIEWFTAFIAADARAVSDETIRALAASMLRSRCAYVCTWGPDCERVHDRFDDEYLAAPSHRWDARVPWSKELPFLVTTWHAREPLPSALWFALYATPTEDGYYTDRTPTFVALAGPRYRSEVRALLLDRERLGRETDSP